MTLIEYIQGLDIGKSIISFDGYNDENGFYINMDELYAHENEDGILGTICLLLPLCVGESICTPSHHGCEENVQYIEGKFFEFLTSIQLVIDEEVSDFKSSITRRPYYKLRGPRVTEQQAFEINSKTDRYFSDETDINKFIGLLHFKNCWFNKEHNPTHYGWCHSNGIIGINSITDKYPTLYGLIGDMIALKFAFPYLDLVAGVTNWDETPEYFESYDDFLHCLQIGLWLHGNSIEAMSPARTRRIYKQYESKYEEVNKEIYEPDYYEKHKLLEE